MGGYVDDRLQLLGPLAQAWDEARVTESVGLRRPGCSLRDRRAERRPVRVPIDLRLDRRRRCERRG